MKITLKVDRAYTDIATAEGIELVFEGVAKEEAVEIAHALVHGGAGTIISFDEEEQDSCPCEESPEETLEDLFQGFSEILKAIQEETKPKPQEKKDKPEDTFFSSPDSLFEAFFGDKTNKPKTH